MLFIERIEGIHLTSGKQSRIDLKAGIFGSGAYQRDPAFLYSPQQRILLTFVEPVKYSVKPGDLVGGYGGEGIPDKADSDFLITLTEQLQNLRTVSLGGIFKEHMAEVDDEDLVHITGEEDDPNRLLDPVIFTWIQAIKRYVIPVS